MVPRDASLILKDSTNGDPKGAPLALEVSLYILF